MKPIIPFALLGALLAVGAANAATTDPVGYVTMNVAGGGTPAAPKFSYIGPSLAVTPTFQGLALGTGTGAVVDFSGTPSAPFTVGQFGLNSRNEGKFYAEIVSGANAGTWADIISNTTTSITLSDSVANLFASQTVAIRQHHTLSSLFTNVSATVPFQKAASIAGADELLILNAASQAQTAYYFSLDDADEDGNPDGWVTAAGLPAADKVVSPVDGITVKRKAAGALAISQAGEVKDTPVKIRIEPGFNVLPINRAVGSSFRLSPLTAAGASDGRTGSNLIASGLTAAASIATADELSILTNGVQTTYYYSTDDADEDGNPDGWVTAGGAAAGNLVIPEGSGLRIRRKLATPFAWTIPAEPIDQNPIVGVSN